MSPRLAGMEAHHWRDGTGTAASLSRRGRREQPRPLQPSQRAGSFPLPRKHVRWESHPGGTHSPSQQQASRAAASPAQAPVPWPETGGAMQYASPKMWRQRQKARRDFCLPSSTGDDTRLSLMSGTKVVTGKLLVFLDPEISFGLVSPENLFQKLANIGKWKPKEIIAVYFPRGRINPFVMSPHAGQADWGRQQKDGWNAWPKFSSLPADVESPRWSRGPKKSMTGCGYLQGGRPQSVAGGLLGSWSRVACRAPEPQLGNKSAQFRAAWDSSQGKREAPGNSWSHQESEICWPGH